MEMRECVEICVTEVEFENVGWNFVRINVGLLRAKYSVLSSMKLEDFNSCETVSSSNTFLLGGFKLRRQAGRYVSSYLVFFQWPCSPTRALGRPQFIFLDDTKLETHTHTPGTTPVNE